METDKRAIFIGLREKILRAKAEDLNIQLDSSSRVWCVVTDIAMQTGSVCLVAMIDGSASMYFSSGGSIVGSVGQQNVRDAATAYTRMCYKSLPEMKITREFPLPGAGVVSFSLLTNNGIYTSSAKKEELVSGQNILSPMFFAANDLITQFSIKKPK
jgi:hypothetical protein